jgi:single-strand DNA-binding protein
MKFTPGGISVANFSLALKQSYKNGGGEKKTNTVWIRCLAGWRWMELAGEFVCKRKFVYVEERLRTRSYQARSSRKHDVTEVVVTTLRFLRPSKNGNGTTAAEPSKPAEAVDESDNPFNGPGSEARNQEIP